MIRKIQVNLENNKPNFSRRQKIIISIIIFSFSLFLLLAFNSYWNTAVVDQAIGEGDVVKNILGPVGAFFSKKLISAFGISAYGIIIILIGSACCSGVEAAFLAVNSIRILEIASRLKP